jgi:single-stranded DNA-specific DHH superfamily exonuclease
MVIITRNKSGEMKCSLRGKNVVVYLKKALEGVEGRGGGHPDACGAVIKEEDWDKFLTQFKEALKK